MNFLPQPAPATKFGVSKQGLSLSLAVLVTGVFLLTTAWLLPGWGVGLLAMFAVASWLALNAYVGWMHQRQWGQAIREDGPSGHQVKAGTPTGGGLVFFGVALAVLLLGQLSGKTLTPVTWSLVAATAGLVLLGFLDDGLKIFKRHNKGVNGWTKLGIQLIVGAFVGWLSWDYGLVQPQDWCWWLISHVGQSTTFTLWLAVSVLVMMGASNAVNLTDGLDGLAGSTAISSLVALSVWLGLGLFIVKSPMMGEWVYCLMVLAACVLGFLWINRYKAGVFMGDTGSLALGGVLGIVMLMMGQPWLLLGFGFLFVVETLSVILQVASYKTTGKRLFRMAPIHHHFELCGWTEVQVCWVFWLVHTLVASVTMAWVAWWWVVR